MVPQDWQHPKNEKGRYVPLLDGFNEDLRKWDEGNAKWQEGLRDDWGGGWKPLDGSEGCDTYKAWAGSRPDPADYMPDWPQDGRTHFQMYEDTSEGTPISPVMESAEKLARWLADTGASALGDMTATYEQWLATIKAGSAPSAFIDLNAGRMGSGVELNS